jgi:hypothetical protein
VDGKIHRIFRIGESFLVDRSAAHSV